MTHLFAPGPVDVAPEVFEAHNRRKLPHRSKEFEAIYQRCWEKARYLFNTQWCVFITTSLGTGLHETAVRNLACQDVLACVNGAFGKRWANVSKSNGKQTDILEIG
jgi:aspartate aminotransferase-like enzyme